MKEWKATDRDAIEKAKYLGVLGVGDSEEPTEIFDILETPDRIVFGGACNVGFLESGYIVRGACESVDETLQELHEDIETYYRDGPGYVSRIVCNERM